jgi:GMP synthase (glutamine-hydrolysing)
MGEIMEPYGIILEPGEWLPQRVREQIGGFGLVFQEQLRWLAPDVNWIITSPAEFSVAHAAEAVGLVITGAMESLDPSLPWIQRFREELPELLKAPVPVLGVCYGHHLVAYLLSGTAERNPRGLEIGAHSLQLTDTGRLDPLMHGLPETFLAYESHFDAVTAMPMTGQLLSSSALCPIQTMAFGPWIRGVQFHPEFNPALMRTIGEEVIKLCENEAMTENAGRGKDALDALPQFVDGGLVLRNFVRHFVRQSMLIRKLAGSYAIELTEET